MTEPLANIASVLETQARLHPQRRAIIAPWGHDDRGRTAWTHLTFRALLDECDRLAHGLEGAGIRRGTRTVLMVTPGLDFAALTFALFKVGAVIVMVDPGMGLRNLGTCLAEAEPEAFIGVTRAHVARIFLGWARRSVKVNVTVGRRLFWGGPTLRQLASGPLRPFACAPTTAEETAAILFTSGSTGVAKGAVYSHGIFLSQLEYLQKLFGFREGDVDMATFPLFALFDPALGVTCVIPDMDASRPATADPARLVDALESHGCSQMFGSPAILELLSRHGKEEGLRFHGLRRVISAGAPARNEVLERMQSLLPEGGEIFTPYGATECLPVSSIGSREILDRTHLASKAGQGNCIGKPIPQLTVKIIRIDDGVVANWDPSLVLPIGEVGEICVRGPIVTQSYWKRPEQTAKAKIPVPGGGPVWHRMGDLGRFDEDGRLWFYGRKAHRVTTAGGTLFTVACEAIFNEHPAVFRTALVGLGDRGSQRPVLCVERNEEGRERSDTRLCEELSAMAGSHEHTREIRDFLFHPAFPVDVRHNAKIRREDLSRWAAGQLA